MPPSLMRLSSREQGRPVHNVPYRRVFQKHDTCLPSSVASVLGGLGLEIDVDAMAEKLTFQGTAIWRVRDWVEEAGCAVRPFIATPELVRKLIRAGLAFVLMHRQIDYYHAMAAVGLDESTQVLVLHDPASIRLHPVLVEIIGEGEHPFGPEAFAMVPVARAGDLDLIPDEASGPFSLYLDFLKRVEIRGLKAAGAVLETMKRRFPDNPFTGRVEAVHWQRTGSPGAAIDLQKQLLREYPDCGPPKDELLASLSATGNSALQREILEALVKRGKLPGASARAQWQYPPAEYSARYADFLGQDRTGYDEAVDLVWSAIGREAFHSGSYHILGDIHDRAGNFTESLLPQYCAAHLDIESHHYARAYFNALHRTGNGAAGFAFLRKRLDRLARTLGAGGVWTTLIRALEDFGYPDEAMKEMTEACEKLPEDPLLQEFAVGFWARMGLWHEAEKSLERVACIGHGPADGRPYPEIHGGQGRRGGPEVGNGPGICRRSRSISGPHPI